VLRLGRFDPGERAHGTHWTQDWMGPRICLNAVGTPGFPVHSLVTISSELPSSWYKSKVKVKLFLCVSKHHAMKLYGGVEV
jgi:hypothetical protein